MDKLKLVLSVPETNANSLYISKENEDYPYLAYLDETGREISILGNSSSTKLIHCSELLNIIKQNIDLGTKFIVNNEDLYTIIPPNSFSSRKSEPFIPIVSGVMTSTVRDETECFTAAGLAELDSYNSDILKVVKVSCTNWTDSDSDTAIEQLDVILDKIQKNINFHPLEPLDDEGLPVEHEIKVDYSKESRDSGIGQRASNVYTENIVIEMLKPSSYTDTIDFSEVITRIKEDRISGKADISVLYSKGQNIYSFALSFKAFEYDDVDNLVIEDLIIDRKGVQVEYFNGILRVFPKDDQINECIISDCIITYGKLL